MMFKLDERGTAAWELCLVAVVFFTLLFLMYDLARYAIVEQSLRMLADAGARDLMLNCYNNQVVSSQTPSAAGCKGYQPLNSAGAMQEVAPFGTLRPQLAVSQSGTALTVTASLKPPGFTMMMPIWGTMLNSPTASTTIPFSS